MVDLRDLIDRFDQLVSVADGLVSDEALEQAGRVGRRARDRRGFLGDTVVIALAGGTGSGKSSLINALASEVVAESGAQRPTTFEPLAWIPANPEPGLVRLLDSIGITDRVGQDRVPWLAVVDLPDTDSVSEDNRATVERVLPLVDAVVWVVDPEKYQDRVLHDRYLRPLSRHSDRFLFVMNHIDRVDEHDVERLLQDLANTLDADGIGSPVVLTTAADPPLGGPQGISEFLEAMQALGDAKMIVERGLVADLGDAARLLASAGGVSTGGGTNFNERWQSTLAESAHALTADLLGADTVRDAGRIGVRTARMEASIRARSTLHETVPVAAQPGAGTRTAIRSVDEMIGGLIESVGHSHAVPIREVRNRIEDEIRSAAVSAGSAASVDLGPSPSWWNVVGLVRPLLAVILGFGGYWIANEMTAVAPIPLVVGLVAAVAVWLAIGAVIAGSGRRWGNENVLAARESLTATVARELDRRVGRPLRDALRIRATLGAAYADFELVRAALIPDP